MKNLSPIVVESLPRVSVKKGRSLDGRLRGKLPRVNARLDFQVPSSRGSGVVAQAVKRIDVISVRMSRCVFIDSLLSFDGAC